MIGENVLKERLLICWMLRSSFKQRKNNVCRSFFLAALWRLSAQKVIREMAQEFALALSNLVCIVHPKLIIIGGKGKNLGPLFLDTVTVSSENYRFSPNAGFHQDPVQFFRFYRLFYRRYEIFF